MKPVKKLWKKRLAAKPTFAVEGEPHAQVTPDGQLAWILANTELGEGGGKPEPFRSLVIGSAEMSGSTKKTTPISTL